jgi:hypothetical protein
MEIAHICHQLWHDLMAEVGGTSSGGRHIEVTGATYVPASRENPSEGARLAEPQLTLPRCQEIQARRMRVKFSDAVVDALGLGFVLSAFIGVHQRPYVFL